MKKNNIVKVLFAVCFFVIAILLVVGAVAEGFAFGILDGIVYLAGSFAAVCLIASAVLERKQGTLLASAVFAAICFGVAIAIGLKWYWAIVIFILYLAILAVYRTLFLRGRHWDAGDNQKPGYKDYKAREAEAKNNAPQDDDKKD